MGKFVSPIAAKLANHWLRFTIGKMIEIHKFCTADWFLNRCVAMNAISAEFAFTFLAAI